MKKVFKVIYPLVLFVLSAVLIPLVDAWFVEDEDLAIGASIHVALWFSAMYFGIKEVYNIMLLFKGKLA